jgi:phosphoglycolate phosphatase-like HAD superfamily hydrolase
MASARPAAFLFDLDGTLVDSVYEHVLAWREALEQVGIELSVWRIHRRIGMSGGLLINALLRETGAEIPAHFVEELQRRHADAYARRALVKARCRASEKLSRQGPLGLKMASLGTGSAVTRRQGAAGSFDRNQGALGGGDERANGRRPPQPGGDRHRLGTCAGDHARSGRACKARSGPLHRRSNQLGVDVANAIVIGDSVWDLLAARRARALGVGLLSGGYGREELERAGAYRVYEDPRDLLRHLDEVGVRRQTE